MPAPRTSVTAIAVTLLALGLPALAAPPAVALPAAVAGARVAPATVTVTGNGSATGTPDIALVNAGVEATAKTTQGALSAQSKAAGELLDAVRGQGVAEKDIRTDSVSLSPAYDYQDGESTLKGYQATQSFTVKVREVSATGALLDAIVKATGDAGRINAVTFDLEDRGLLQARAREAAHDDAHAKAAQYARLSGHRLGRLVSLSESDTGYFTPAPPIAADAPSGGVGGVPVAPGEIKATSTITAVYELD